MKMKIERWRDKAQLFLENNIPCFIKTIDNSYHSGDILFVGENSVHIYDFIKKEKFRIYWLDMVIFSEYKGGVK